MFSFVVLHVQCNLCLRDKYSRLLKPSDRLRNLCLFRYLIALFPSCRLSSTCNFNTYSVHHTTVVNNGLRAVHVYWRQIARFLCVCLSQRGRLFLGQIRQNAEAKTEIGPPSADRALYSDKARSLNLSQCTLYRNFIIKLFK